MGFIYSFIVLVIAAEITDISACGRGAVTIDKNGYKNILIAIDDRVEENEFLLTRIQEAFTEASSFLYNATRQRAFLEEITILVPAFWQGNYSDAGNETFDKSDIVVDPSHVNTTDQPFVIKPTPCMIPGYFMRLTTDFLTNDSVASQFGPYGKVLVHEWAHLRFGVFDERPSELDEHHFYASTNGRLEAIRCSTAITGRPYNTTTGQEGCSVNGNLPGNDCRFMNDELEEEGYGSLMYNTYLDHLSKSDFLFGLCTYPANGFFICQVTEFCDDGGDDIEQRHNKEAPTLQNVMCGRRSVMEIIRNHPDFYEANPPAQVNDTTPTFNIVRPRLLRTVLVLDESNSMAGCKIEVLGQGCSNYISTIIKDEGWLGMVWFNTNPIAKREMTPINDTTRELLLDDIPKEGDLRGGTTIGGGIREAINMLKRHQPYLLGGSLIVVTDGAEVSPPMIADVVDEVFESRVTLHSIAITESADSNLDKLALATGGLAYILPDCRYSNVINEAFHAIGELQTSPTNRSYVLTSEVVIIEAGDTYQGSIIVDKSLGRNTQFVFDYEQVDIEPVVTSPTGAVYTKNDNVTVTHDAMYKVYRFTIPQAEFTAGEWHYRVPHTFSGQNRVAITVKSQSAVEGEYPIVATVHWAKRNIPSIAPGQENEVQAIYASVSQGYTPILYAHVEARVSRPGESDFDVKVLRDDGTSADIKSNDGIYSAYYTGFNGNGRYGVTVFVNSTYATVLSPERIIGAGSPKKRSPQQQSDIPVDRFTRTKNGGSFELEQFTAGGKLYPPGQVTNLHVESIGYDNHTVELSWTAVGDQLDEGQVTFYDLRFGTSFEEMELSFENQTQVTDDMIVSNTNLSLPLAAGQGENHTIMMPNEGAVTYVFALKAIDKDGRDATGPMSNLVTASMEDYTTFPPLEDPGLSGGAIAGICILCVAVLAAVSMAIVFQTKKPNKVKVENQYENQSFDGKDVEIL